MSRLTRSWLVMSVVVAAVALLFTFVPWMPRLVWLAIVMTASFIKARLILLDYLELRDSPGWRSGAVLVSGALILMMALLAAPA